jgi:hypothetical protein
MAAFEKLTKNYPAAIAWCLLCLATAAGFYIDSVQDDELAQQDRELQAEIDARTHDFTAAIQRACDLDENLRITLIKYINEQSVPTPYPADATPAQKQAIDTANQRRAETRESFERTFSPQSCAGEDLPEGPAQGTTTTTGG